MKWRRTILSGGFWAVVFLGFAMFTHGQAVQRPKIFISADFEGVGQVVGKESLAPGAYEFERARKLLTAEVNAAIEGCLEAGAGEIVVADSHGNCINLNPEELNESAVLIRATPRPLDMMAGIDETFAGAIMIGYHARSGIAGANIAATMALSVLEMRINDRIVSEVYINGGVAGDFNVPVIMVAGDQYVVKDAKEVLGNIETVQTKESLGFLAAKSPHPNVLHREIKEKANKAVLRIKEFKPLRVEGPIRFQIGLKNAYDAERACLLPWFHRIDGNTILVELQNMKEVANIILGLGLI